jgi:hypothetical protein
VVWVALGAGGLLFALWLLRFLANAPVAALRQGVLWSAGLTGAGLLLLLVASGRTAQVVGALGVLAPFAWRWWRNRRVARRFGAAAGGAPGGEKGGGESRVETATLEMRLDHGTGSMSGRVRSGPQAGRELAELSRTELLALLAACRADDPDSVPLLEAWLDRADPDWRQGAEDGSGRGAGGSRPGGGGGPMSRQEALAVLGLAEGASEEEIRAAHRRLMRAAHPDGGGSDWLAARVNEARDVLLP